MKDVFLVTDGMKYKDINHDGEISMVENLTYEHCYNMNNSVVVFVENGKVYIFPYNQKKIDELIANGFKKCNMYVPFSSGATPLENIEEYNRIFGK